MCSTTKKITISQRDISAEVLKLHFVFVNNYFKTVFSLRNPPFTSVQLYVLQHPLFLT